MVFIRPMKVPKSAFGCVFAKQKAPYLKYGAFL